MATSNDSAEIIPEIKGYNRKCAVCKTTKPLDCFFSNMNICNDCCKSVLLKYKEKQEKSKETPKAIKEKPVKEKVARKKIERTKPVKTIRKREKDPIEIRTAKHAIYKKIGTSKVPYFVVLQEAQRQGMERSELKIKKELVGSGRRLCTRCGMVRSIKFFRFDPYLVNMKNTKSWCMDCERKYQIEYRSKNYEKAIESVRKYREKNIEKIRKMNREYHYRKKAERLALANFQEVSNE